MSEQTGLGSTDSSEPKRKNQPVDTLVEVGEILATIDSNEKNVDALGAQFTKMKKIFLDSDAFPPSKKAKLGMKVTSFKGLGSWKEAASLLGLDFLNEDLSYLWEMPRKQKVALSNEADTLLEKMYTTEYLEDKYYPILSLFARRKTDIVLFDCMLGYWPDLATRHLSIQGNYVIATEVHSRREITRGNADYVLGYRRPTETDFETIYAIIVQGDDYGDLRLQAIAYMVGTQQEGKAASSTVYAIVSGDTTWSFFRLSGKKLEDSGPLGLNGSYGRDRIASYIAIIIKEAIALDISLYGPESKPTQ